MFSKVCKEERIPILLVTHDLRAASFVDRAFTLRDGTLMALELESVNAALKAPSVST